MRTYHIIRFYVPRIFTENMYSLYTTTARVLRLKITKQNDFRSTKGYCFYYLSKTRKRKTKNSNDVTIHENNDMINV